MPLLWPRAKHTRQRRLLVFAGQCWLWRHSSLLTFVAVPRGPATKLGWGDLDAFQLLRSNFLPGGIWCIYLAPHEDNRIKPLGPNGGKTISWYTWRHSSNSCLPYDYNCLRVPCAVYALPRYEVSKDGCCRHKNFLQLVMGPHVNFSSVFQTNADKSPLVFNLTSPLLDFNFFGSKSGGISFLLRRTVLHEFIFPVSKSSQILVMKTIVHKYFVP